MSARSLARRALLLAAMLISGASAVGAAQTVVEFAGSGSSLIGGYGATANYWRSGVDGWIGLGYLHGLRAGAFLRTMVGRDTLRMGNDALGVRFPTDVFAAGFNLLVQGVGYTGGTRTTSYQLFGGASSDGLGAPSFQPTSLEAPLGAMLIQHQLSDRLRLSGAALISDRQTVAPGVEWQLARDVTGALVTAVGSGRPYLASSLALRRGSLGLKTSYAWNPDRFRRLPVPSPNQTEVDRENLQLTYDLSPDFTIGAARQNFVQDSSDQVPLMRASGNSLFAGGRWRDLRLAAGLYDSRAADTRNLSSYFAVGRTVAAWLDAEFFLLQSRPDGRPATTTPITNLRWTVSPRLGLMQQISIHERRPIVLLGASLRTAIGEFSADYQIVHQPFRPFNPFRSALNLTARLQLGGYSTSVGTYVQPDGSVDYSASGSTFLYLGEFGGVQPQQVGTRRLGRYVVRGVVRDEEGRPIEGAALGIGGETVFTNSQGEFFLRVGQPRSYPVEVRLAEFLFAGKWEVVSAPSETRAEREEGAHGIEILLRAIAPPLPAVPEVLSPSAHPDPRPNPADGMSR